MNLELFAIEHQDGGRWLYQASWPPTKVAWLCDPDQIDGFIHLDHSKAQFLAERHGGTVVTFTLTRTPELKVGARVVHVDEVLIVEGAPRLAGSPDPIEVVRLDDGDDWATNTLIVLPEGFYQPPNKNPEEVEP